MCIVKDIVSFLKFLFLTFYAIFYQHYSIDEIHNYHFMKVHDFVWKD